MSSDGQERATQRDNLFLVSRLAIRQLLELGMSREDRLLTGNDPELVNLFVVFEKVLRHGIRGGGVLWKNDAQGVWVMLRRLALVSQELSETLDCVEALPNATTYVCRIRAWIRLVVMQSKLADYLSLLTDAASPVACQHYEDWALLRYESTAVPLVGSLLGLRAVRCDIYLKEQNFKQHPADVDLSLLIKLPTLAVDNPDQSDGNFDQADSKLKSLLDQTSYLEERNLLLQARNEALKVRVENPELQSEDDISAYRNKNAADELEVALSLVERDVHQKQDTICSLREQLVELKNINANLYKQLRLVEGSSREKEFQLLRLTERHSIAERKLHEMTDESQARIDCMEHQLDAARSSLQTFETELERSGRLCRELQVHLQDEREANRLVDEQLQTALKENAMLKEKLNVLADAEANNRELRGKCTDMAKRIMEYEKALEEVGVHLSQSKLKVEDLKEGLLPFVDVRWEDDKNVTDCQKCASKFSVSRRKHHCRHCGGIFCQQCSENTLPLPSSSKPARVCDRCFSLLLDRLTSKIGLAAPAAAESPPK